MASRKRRHSMSSPASFSELINKLDDGAASFIHKFTSSKQDMLSIVREFEKVADDVRRMQRETDTARTVGAVVAVGSLVAAPFTGGLSLLAAEGGAAVVVGANIVKMIKEKGTVEKVERLGKRFMELVEPLKSKVTEISEMCEELEERSIGSQAKRVKLDVEEFGWILDRVSELARRTKEVRTVFILVCSFMANMWGLILRIIRVTTSTEDDEKLIESILKAADQCQKVVTECDRLKTKLEVFRER
ncbi:uncharacterized protein LOC121960290 [Plectropomus leopardus]|uniref:uncharacterized protein LOC121960290 n=1 Tax=Plectropomus leopardus TaxID=160734 RepID=UPI001C4C3CBD|nr:uncharacterized protein LOC121960290 [Plectropomus leopardus]